MLSPLDVLESGVRLFDDFQQRHRWLAQPVGTIRKYADDRGSSLAGLVTFQVFLGMLPLLVVALTVFGRILETDAQLEEAVLDSTLVQFPVIGARLKENISALTVEGPWIWITIAGLLWTATGIYNGFQLALNQVWNVSGVDRQGFVSRLLRALVLFILVFAAAIGTYFLRGAHVLGIGSGLAREVLSLLVGSLVAAVLLLGVFRIVTAPVIETARLIPAALLAGLMWEVLQRLGAWLIMDRLSRAQDLYGAIGFVVVTLTWINLLARSVVLANEFAVVAHRGLWPRRIAQPPLSAADREVLVGLLRNERRRPEEHIVVSFDPDHSLPASSDDSSSDDRRSDDRSSGDSGDGSSGDGTRTPDTDELIYRVDPETEEPTPSI